MSCPVDQEHRRARLTFSQLLAVELSSPKISQNRISNSHSYLAMRVSRMWFVDLILDIPWYVVADGDLGAPKSRALQRVSDPDLQIELLLYGDEEAIRHLRVLLDTEDPQAAQQAVGKNVMEWINSIEIASAIATPTCSTAAKLHPNSASFMVFIGAGDETSPAFKIDLQGGRTVPEKSDFDTAAMLMAAWKPDFRTHLHFLGRFLNRNLTAEMRWLNGYRFIEWHFCRGKGSLPANAEFRQFLADNGQALDQFLRQGQTRHGLLEEMRAMAAHAIQWDTQDPRSDGGRTDPILQTYSALEILVRVIMDQGAEGVTFRPMQGPGSPNYESR
jgi:hypothetical protein